MQIRLQTVADASAIRAVVDAAFGRRDESDLVARLEAAGDVLLSLVAADAGTIVGHVLFSRLRIEQPAGVLDAVALAPLAVRPRYQRRGIGSALVREGLRRLHDAGEHVVIVLGEPEFYGRFNFSAELSRTLRAPFSGPAFMAIDLAPRGPGSGEREHGRSLEGRVVYPPAFRISVQDH